MKTTKQRLLNIVIALSVAINLVMVGGLGYLASMDNYVKKIHAVMNSPVVIYVSNTTKSPGGKTMIKPSATE